MPPSPTGNSGMWDFAAEVVEMVLCPCSLIVDSFYLQVLHVLICQLHGLIKQFPNLCTGWRTLANRHGWTWPRISFSWHQAATVPGRWIHKLNLNSWITANSHRLWCLFTFSPSSFCDLWPSVVPLICRCVHKPSNNIKNWSLYDSICYFVGNGKVL